jgi:hypothetical protein
MKIVSAALGALIAGAGCGSVNSNPGDAGGGGSDGGGTGQLDGGPGDSSAPIQRGAVQVTVVDPSGSGVPAVGVTVVFVDPDGTVVKTANTDSNGKASADVLPGASVTTVAPRASSFQMRTMLAVKPGDDLVIGPKVIDTRVSGTFTLSWPDAPNHATTFSVYGPCGFVGLTTFNPSLPGPTAPTTLSFGLQNGCRPETGEILIWARGQNGTSLHFNDNTDVPLSAGGSFAMANMWNGGFTFSASYTNAASVSTITSDRIVPDGGRSAPVTMPATDNTTIGMPGPFGVTARMVSKFAAASGAKQTVRQKLPGSATTYALNVNATLLAWLNAPTFNAAVQELQIIKLAPSAAAAAEPDLLKVSASWQRGSTQYSWEVFGPDATTVKLPVLPEAAGAGLNPTSADVLQTTATSFEADTVAGYDAVRANAGAAITDLFVAPRSPAALIRISESPPPPSPGGELRGRPADRR